MFKKLTLILIVVSTAILLIWYYYPFENTRAQTDLSNNRPTISTEDILNNPELKQGVLKAVQQNNVTEIERLQRKAIQIGRAANFNDAQMQRLQGVAARDYLIFRAKRELFYQAFTQRYQSLQDIQDLKAQYPEAQSLFNQADALIKQRDTLVVEIAKVLAGEGQDHSLYIQQAKAEWRSRQQSLLPVLD